MVESIDVGDGLRPPYYAVIFTSELAEGRSGYELMAERMVELAGQQSGFLGLHSARDGASGITVSYWESEEAIASWRANLEHQAAQEKGRSTWYRSYRLQVAKVERCYGGGSK